MTPRSRNILEHPTSDAIAKLLSSKPQPPAHAHQTPAGSGSRLTGKRLHCNHHDLGSGLRGVALRISMEVEKRPSQKDCAKRMVTEAGRADDATLNIPADPGRIGLGTRAVK